jgi:hypothetical protein
LAESHFDFLIRHGVKQSYYELNLVITLAISEHRYDLPGFSNLSSKRNFNFRAGPRIDN